MRQTILSEKLKGNVYPNALVQSSDQPKEDNRKFFYLIQREHRIQKPHLSLIAPPCHQENK